MLYSESKERENQFVIALKIGFPFLLLAFMLFYLFKISDNTLEHLILSISLVPIYVYYIFYLIYNGFKSTLIEPITKTFTRKEILERIEKLKRVRTIVLIRVENISDINERYGITIADNILYIFSNKLNDFFKSYNFKDIPIGRYGGGNFLLIINGKTKELTHLLTIFSKELKNIGINDIEIKIDFSLIESNYDSDVSNIVKKLLLDIDKNKIEESLLPNIKPDEFEKIIIEAIESEKFIFKFQPSYDKSENIKILEVLVKIYSKSYGMLSYYQIERVVNQSGYETIFYKKMLTSLVKEIKNKDLKDVCFSIKMSAVTLRNNEFRIFINQLLYKNRINPNIFILEFGEEKKYKEIKRFNEIINQYRKLGFKMSIDNFAGDNSSLEYIKNLKVDLVKFDIEFTKYIDDSVYFELFSSYMELLKKLKIKSMVKFVDKADVYEKVKLLNPDFIQGFIVSKPKSLKHILPIIEEKKV